MFAACVGGAGRSGNVAAVRSWVASGADINVLDVIGGTPLMLASRYHHAECVAELLRLGADVHHTNHGGETALHEVAWRDRDGDEGAEVVRLLVAAGCDAAARDIQSCTAVECANIRSPEWSAKLAGWISAAVA